ncbi:MAG TPA: helicase C-terminal domain-containing protein [Planctomycetota bacterium]|nr:helicase C-terminal domain-containing protein [Planctomycetota bacterium]
MDAAQILGPDGPVARKLENYEPRTEQTDMAAAVERALTESRHLLVEAGTGVGKSFAYLVPVIDCALGLKQPVVVSTNTISLQEQLIGKDIPFLKTVLPQEFTACLVKGRANFVCQRRLAYASRIQSSLFGSEAALKDLWRIEDWARRTKDGTLSDFDRQPMSSVWANVNSDHDNCAGKACEHAERDCFYQRARRRMYHVNLLVVNHHIVCTDLVLRERGAGFLPGYSVLVLDEGHSFEGVATDHLGLHLSSGQVERFLSRLHNPRTEKGFLVHLREKDTVSAVRRARRAAADLFRQVSDWRMAHAGTNGRIHEPDLFRNPLTPALKELAVSLETLRPRAKGTEEAFEIAGYRNRALDLAAGFGSFIAQAVPDAVYWVEYAERRGRPQVKLESSPVSVASELKRLLFDELRTVIVTSATLCVGEHDSFDFVRSRLGMHSADELRVGSPFDYDRQMKVYVPEGMPDPNEDESFTKAVIREVERYLRLSHGRAFVLFTSYRLLDAVAKAVRPKLEDLGIESFVQGEGIPRTRMLERFRADTSSVIFGTDSFWQGVDVRGESLSNVIITRLPFSVPDHPVVQARLEKIREEGGDPFMSYTVPEAVIRFKQGVGRLIRTRTDTGIIVVLDPRIATRRYGQLFYQSLPTSSVYRRIETEEAN